MEKVGGYCSFQLLMKEGRHLLKGAFSAIPFLCSITECAKCEDHGARPGAWADVRVLNVGTASRIFLLGRPLAQ